MIAEGSRMRRRLPAVLLASAVALAGCGQLAAPAPRSPAVPGASTGVPAASDPGGPAPTPAPPDVPLPTTDPGAGPPDPVPGRPFPRTSHILQPIPARQLQARLDALRERRGIPGISVTIRWLDGRTWTGTSGIADTATGEPVTAGTAFAYASVSKTFTAAVALLLVESGELALDDRVANLLPELELDPRITVRMLLDHTSGLADFFLNPAIDKALQGKPNAAWDVPATLRYVRKPVGKPGARFFYSNTNYLLLGEVVEAVTGDPLATVVRDRLLEPLGLSETWFQVAEPPATTTARGHRVRGKRSDPTWQAVGAANGLMPFRSVLTAAGGAGAMAGTSRDAALWIETLAARGLLRADTRAAMRADAAATAALGARVPYGLGIQVVRLAGREAVGHTGRLLGFRSLVRYLPADGVSIAVLMNENGVDPIPIAQTLLRLVLSPRADCPTCPEVR